MANWKKVLVSGSAIEVLNITASSIPARTDQSVQFLTIDSDGKLLTTGSSGGSGGIFTNQGDFQNNCCIDRLNCQNQEDNRLCCEDGDAG